MNQAWEWLLRGAGQGQAAIEPDDLAGYSWDGDSGTFKSKGKPDVGVDHPLFNTLTDNTDENGVYRPARLYKPINSGLANMFAPENVNFVNKANAQWLEAPTVEAESALREDKIRQGLAKSAFERATSGDLNPDSVNGPYDFTHIGAARQSQHGNQIGLPELNGDEQYAASQRNLIKNTDAINKGIDFSSNDAELASDKYREGLAQSNSRLLAPREQLDNANINSELGDLNFKEERRPLTQSNQIGTDQITNLKVGELLKNPQLIQSVARSGLVKELFQNSIEGDISQPNLGRLGYGTAGLTMDSVRNPTYQSPFARQMEMIDDLKGQQGGVVKSRTDGKPVHLTGTSNVIIPNGNVERQPVASFRDAGAGGDFGSSPTTVEQKPSIINRTPLKGLLDQVKSYGLVHDNELYTGKGREARMISFPQQETLLKNKIDSLRKIVSDSSQKPAIRQQAYHLIEEINKY